MRSALAALLLAGCSAAAAPRPMMGERKPSVRIGSTQPKSRLIDMTLAPAQALEAVDRSLGELEELVRRAGEANCDLVVLPEDTLGLGRWEAANPGKLAQVLPEAVRRMLDRLGRAAAAHRMYLVCCNDTLEDGAEYNTAFFLGRDGREIGRYRKVNMPLHELSKRRGAGFPVFQTPDLGAVGMLICYDMVFPEAARCLALAGADLIVHPTLGGAAIGDGDISRCAFRVRAAENFVYVVVSQRGGGTMAISPRGEILGEAKGPDALLVVDIDPFGGRQGGDAMNHQRDMRARLFRERSPEAFGLLTDPNPPVLAKVPETITIDRAVEVSRGVLTVGEDRFRAASILARDGKTAEARAAFEALVADYPDSWIDREARKRLGMLTK
jgi:predicted amidohydrolase